MATHTSEFIVRPRDRVLPRPPSVVWAIAGFVLGILITLLVLVLLAPAPAQTATAPPLNTGITVSIDDASLAQVISDGLVQANVPFHTTNVHARILPGNMVDISGDAEMGILGAQHLSATGQLTALDGHLSIHITRGTVGGLALPAPIVTAIESALNNQFVQLGGMLILGGNRYVVTGISTVNGLLTLSLGNH